MLPLFLFLPHFFHFSISKGHAQGRTAFHGPARVVALGTNPEIFFGASQKGAQDRMDIR